MQEISAEQIRQVLNDPDPVLEALSMLLKSVGADAVEILASMLATMGHDPSQLPGEFFVQAVMIEAEKVFRPISREKWIAIYDSYQSVKRAVESDPLLQAEVQQHKLETPNRMRTARHTEPIRRATERRATPTNINDILDGNF